MADLVTLFCVVIGLFLLYKYFRSEQQQPRPPGPKGYPVVGSALQLIPDKIHEQFFAFAQTYGKVFQIQIFDSTTLVLNSVDTVYNAFCGDEYKHIFNNRPKIYFAEQFYFGGTGTTYIKTPDENHTYFRKLFSKGLHVYGDGVAVFEEVVKHEIGRVVDEIEQAGDDGFEVVDTTRRSMCNIISMLLIGKEATSEDVTNFFGFVMGEDFFINPLTNMILSNFPFLRYTPIYKHEFEKAISARTRALQKYFVEMKVHIVESWKAGSVRGLVDYYIEDQMKAVADNKEPVMTDERIQANVLDVIAAGILTTSAVLPSIMLCLLNHPEYQTQIQEELDRVVGRDREPSVKDKHACHFLEAVVMEALRYLPPVPMLLPHVCSKDTMFEGYQVKSNTVVLANIWYIQHDETIWGDPWVFRPERFLDDNGKLLPSTHTLMKSNLPFGLGRRRCPGDGLARTRIFLYLATFFQRWSFVPVPGKCGPCDPRIGEYDFEAICKPKPFHCIAEKRQWTAE